MADKTKNQNQGGKKSDKSKQLGLEVEKSVATFSEWYQQVIMKSEMIEFYDISGCYILRPWSFQIWEQIQEFFNKEIKKLGVKNSYFPLFVSQRALTAEKDHIEGFAPEVAWVTKSGKSNLTEPIAVRPTSETIMYPAFAKWIRSHRDLPLKVNQWCNVVRWEFKRPTPFLRSREFLWQEGHTAFATEKEAGEEVLQILELYKRVYEELLAVPVFKGKKTENEKFPGGYYTTTVEAFIPTSGRGIQAGTSHCLGQNFAKMFNIQFENINNEKQFAWQNSWGLTTRSIGIMIMTHGDNKGLILPPRVAPIQVVFVPIFKKDVDSSKLLAKAREVGALLESNDIRVFIDDSDVHNPGFKYSHWEMKGVPLRIEWGMQEVEKNTAVVVRRDTGAKESVSLEGIVNKIKELLDTIHNAMLQGARDARDEKITKITKWEEFTPALDARQVVLAPWCDKGDCEDKIKKTSGEEAKANEQQKKQTKKDEKKVVDAAAEEEFEPLTGAAKSLCIPFDQPTLEPGTKCFHCGADAKFYCFFGRSY